jgi:uncharacterized protein involved in exopolysaccharide biosynthesis
MIDDRQRLAGELMNLMSGIGAEGGGRRLESRRLDQLESRVMSRPFLERVVRLLQIHEDPRIRSRARTAVEDAGDVTVDEMAVHIAVTQLRNKISIRYKGTSIYGIQVRDASPRNAQLLARWISELYVDTSNQDALEDLNKAREFGQEQLKVYEQRLAEAEEELEQYKQLMIQQDLSKGVVTGENVNAAEALYRKILDEAELARLRTLPYSTDLSNSELSEARGEVFQNSRVRNQARGLGSALIEEVRNRLLAGTAQGGEWPPPGGYTTMRRGLLQLIERVVGETFPDATSSDRDVLARYVFTSLDRDAQDQAAEFLGQEIAQFRRKAQLGPRDELELARLQNEVQTAQDLLQSFQAQLVASDVSQAVAATDMGKTIEIIDPAPLPMEPTEPNRPKILVAAILMGPFFGILLGLVVEVADPTLRSLRDFQRVFEGPIIGTAPLIMRSEGPRRRLRAYAVPTAITLVVVLTVAFFLSKDSFLSEQGGLDAPVVVVDPESGGTS